MSGLQLTAPTALLAFIPLGAAIVVLYLLKLRRRELTVPSVLLWRRAVEDVQANAPFQKLRANLLLLLQLLALAALVGGVAAPFVMARRLPDRTVIIVLDASASMGATDVRPSRFDHALRHARDVVGAMRRSDEVALVVCGARPQVAVPLTPDARRLERALEGLTPTDCSTTVRDGLMLGASLASKRPNATVYLISDGGFGELPDLPTSADVRFLTVGERCENVAILAFEVTQPPGSEESQLFLRLRNYGASARECELSVYHEDEVVDARRITLAGDADRAVTWAARIAQPGLMKAELRADDDLRADNVAFAQAAAGGGRVLVVGPENLFLEQVLAIQPGIELFRVESLSEAQAAEAWEAYDAIIFDRASVPAPPERGAALLIDAGGWPGLATRGEAVEEPRISSWEAEHPVLRHVNLRAVGIAEAHALRPGPEGTAIARADDAPMVVALERDELRAVALGWNLLDSDLPLRVGFPVLLRNILGWLGDVRGGEVARVVRPGATVRFAAPPEVASADLVMPDGRRRSVEAMGGELTVAGSQSVGLYRLVSGQRRWRWAADLRDPAESDLTPRAELTVGGKVMAAGRREVRTQRHLWPWLVALALVALAVEWHFYHRRC